MLSQASNEQLSSQDRLRKLSKRTPPSNRQVSFQFVLPIAVAQLHIHDVEYSAMCNCKLREVQTGLD